MEVEPSAIIMELFISKYEQMKLDEGYYSDGDIDGEYIKTLADFLERQFYRRTRNLHRLLAQDLL